MAVAHVHEPVGGALEFLASAMRWLMLLLLIGFVLWLVNVLLRRAGWLAGEGKPRQRNAP